MSRGPELAAFIEVGGLDRSAAEALAALARPDRLGSLVTRAIVHGAKDDGAWPRGWTGTGSGAVEACGWAFDLAANAGLPLLVVAAGAQPSVEAVGALAEGLEIDPLFGIAIPRFADPASGRIALHEPFGPGDVTAPRRVLRALTDYRIVAERLAPCMLIRRELVGNLALRAGEGLWPSLADFVLRARRAGFRPVRCNRAVVILEGAVPWGCTAAEATRLRQANGEPDRAAPPPDTAVLGERLLAQAFDQPRSLVIDARNLTPVYNGTSAAILGACDGLHRVRPEPAVSLWLHPDAADFYKATTRFGNWTVTTEAPAGRFAAGLRLSQPWHASELDSLRDLAAVNVFWMLDTIAWDIGYAAMPDLDHTWQRLGAQADGILFISQFSLERFAHRFTVSPEVHLVPCPLSLDATEYALPVSEGPRPPFWLVVGNRYDHKHVGPTVDLLARAFPARSLVVFGDRHQPRAERVIRFTSGKVDDAVVRGCYAGADIVIFPSFYEGFGLPMVEGLAYGRTVVTRDSALVRELATRYRGPGRLFVYATERELVDLLGRLDRGDTTGAIPLTSTREDDVWNWDAVASRLLQTTDALVARAPSSQMLLRSGLARGIANPHRAARRAPSD